MKHLKIADQSEVQDQIAALVAEASAIEATLPASATARPALGEDALLNLDMLTAHVASLKVSAAAGSRRTIPMPPPPPPAPAPKAAAVAVAPKAAPAAKAATLTATARCVAASAKPAATVPASVAPAAAKPVESVAAQLARRLTATEKVLLAQGHAIPAQSNLSATARCLATKSPKATAPKATPAPARVPMPAAFTDSAATVRDAESAVVNLEIGARSRGIACKRPARTGNDAADVAALTEYRQALQSSFLASVEADKN